MKKHYPWLCFDADNTLFDFKQAEVSAFRRTLEFLGMPYSTETLELYQRINAELWRALERHEITPADLRTRRFGLLLDAAKLGGSPEQMSQVYIQQLAQCADLVDGAEEVLAAVRPNCRIAIVTNGLQAVQTGRLSHSTIAKYVDELIISEAVGAAKPHAAFFDAAFVRMGHPPKSDVLVIGDSLSSDIQGGVDYGLDTCWFNPAADPRPADLPITYEIRHLCELLELIE
jgi:2-haloacid dehalogenase